jgi:hypothetical protein
MAQIVDPEKRARRAAASRRNGALSKGPLTDETKFISSKNALKDGFHGSVHALPDEPETLPTRLREQWQAEKQPRDLEESVLVEDLFRGHLGQMRYYRARDRMLISQAEQNLARWKEERQKAAATMKAAMETASDSVHLQTILKSLMGFGEGVQLLITEYETLGVALDLHGCWSREQSQTAVRLFGMPPRLELVTQCVETYRLCLYNLLSQPQPPRDDIERLLEPVNRPLELRGASRAELLPPAAECRAALREWINEEVGLLQETYGWVLENVDGPVRAKLTDPAAIVMDPEEAKRYQRAASEYQSTFYRASKELRTRRKEEAAAESKQEMGTNAGRADRRGSARSEPNDAPFENARRPVATDPQPAP